MPNMSSQTTTMKAVHYEQPFKVSVKEVEIPQIEHPDDAIIKVTTAGSSLTLFINPTAHALTTSIAICGSDLHMYQGRTAAESGLIFGRSPQTFPYMLAQNSQTPQQGHENMGIIVEIGSGVTLLKKGDRIVLPFNVADGRCRNCEEGKTAFCTGVNPGFAGGAYGYVAMGPYQGGQVHSLSPRAKTPPIPSPSQTPVSILTHPLPHAQAQYLRIPYADFNALTLPPGTAHESDFALLADIFPTGWHGLNLAGFQPGESVAVFGAGPVGLMAAYSATLRGASAVYVVDRVPERLRVAEKIGCVGIDFSEGDAVDMIVERNGGMVDRAVDAVGYQAVGSGKGGQEEVPNVVLEQLIRVTRPTGGLGIPGLYVPSMPFYSLPLHVLS